MATFCYEYDKIEKQKYDETNDKNVVNEFLKQKDLHLSSPLASSYSTKISLEAIRIGEAGLNLHRTILLNRVPERNQYSSFPLNNIEIKDLAYLSAHEGDEFVLLRGKASDVLFHGEPTKCPFPEELEAMLIGHKLELIAHSHPDKDIIIPSDDDILYLRKIGQNKSKIISWYTGNIIEFYANKFDNKIGG